MKSFLKLVSALAAIAGLLCACSNAEESHPIRVRVAVDRPLLPCGGTERVVLKVCLDGLRLPVVANRPPVNIALVLDRSGSMSGDKIAKAREAAIEVVRRLSPNDIFSLVAYDSSISTLIPAARVRDKGALEEIINSIEANGGTALFGGVSQGASEIRRHLRERKYVHRVVLLSDGQANVGPSSTSDLRRLGTALMKEGISVTTIGLGLGFNEDLMTGLSQCSDGNTYFVESSADLPRIFSDELGDVLDVVARSVSVEIDFPEGVRPLAFVGREGVINGRHAEFRLNQLYGGQEKFALIEVEVQPGSAGMERSLAEARVQFEDVRSNKSLQLAASGSVRYSEDNYAVEKAVDQKVQTDYVTNVIADAKDQVVALVDAGRKEEASALMRAKANVAFALPAASANVELKAQAELALRDADDLDEKGLSNSARKSYRADSAQTKRQQRSR